MTLSLYRFVPALLCMILLMSGCELVNQGAPTPPPPSGQDLVINEVFSIPPDQYYAFSWIEIFNPTNEYKLLSGVSSPSFAYSYGTDGTFIQSGDDGQTWSPITFNPPLNVAINAAGFFNADTGYLAGDNGLLKKMKHDSTGYNLFDLPNPAGPVNFHDCFATPSPSRIVLACGDAGVIIQSINRGASFTQVVTGTSNNILAIEYLDQNHIYAVGEHGTILKGNVALRWSAQSAPFIQANATYRSLGFFDAVDASRGYIVGDGGAMAYTTNGGIIWNPVTSGTRENLRSLFVPRPDQGFEFRHDVAFAVGDRGTILRLKDSTWSKIASGSSADLYSVKFIDSSRGWALGDGGVILATTNGGDTWFSQPSNTSSRLMGISLFPLQFDLVSFYQLNLYAQRNYVFFDPGTGTINQNVIEGVDSGIVNIGTIGFALINGSLMPITGGVLPPRSFAVINNDSTKFGNHTNLGPTNNNAVVNINVGLLGTITNINGVISFRPYKWALPASGEARLYKRFLKLSRGPLGGQIVASNFKCIDCVRWGGFKAVHNEFYVTDPSHFNEVLDDQTFDQNQPLGYIPLWSSMARYFNDLNVDVTKSSTASSFYFTDPSKHEEPLPGWPSERGK